MVIGDLLNSRAELSPHLEALIYNGDALLSVNINRK